jgi:hypothetical protein
LATIPIRPIVSIAPPLCRAATAVYWASAPQATVRASRDATSGQLLPPAGEGLDRDPGQGEEKAGEDREQNPAALGQALGPVTQRDAGGQQDQPALEADDRRHREAGMGAVEVRKRRREEGEPAAAERQRQPLPSLDRVAEEALREHREGDRAAGEHRLHERDRGQRQRRDVGEPGQGGESPAGGEPRGGGEAAQARQRSADVDGLHLLAATMLEQRGQVGHQRDGRGEADPDLHGELA